MSEVNPAELFGISGRSVLVTGGAGAIGSKLVASLQQLGAKVASFDLPAAHAKNAVPGALVLAGDATAEADAQAAVAQTAKEFGSVDILVNGAGINIRSSLTDLKVDDFNAVMDANLQSALHFSRAFAKQEGGRDRAIVNIASIAGRYAFAGSVAYCASKAAMISLTQVCALEWASLGIRVNAIAPTVIKTPMMAERLSSPTQSAGLLSRIPIGRFGEPEDLVGPIVFLASKASAFVSGHILMVDGGRSAFT